MSEQESMPHSYMLDAVETVVERLVDFGGSMRAALPPLAVMSEQQQIDAFLQIIGDPLLVRVMRMRKGEDEFRAWYEAMQRKIRLHGKMDLTLTQELEEREKEDILMAMGQPTPPFDPLGYAPEVPPNG